MPHRHVAPLYAALTRLRSRPIGRDLRADAVADALIALIQAGRAYLQTLPKRELISGVAGKSYFVFHDETRGRSSRAVNLNLYIEDLNIDNLRAALSCAVEGLSEDLLTRIIYTATISYCGATDILKTGDQKTPGTFFEILIGHIVAKALNANPARQITVPTLDIEVTIPTDYIFDLGIEKNRVHLPIKLSTRERVVQVWAHQRVLDGMHGVARFKGVLVAMAETNKQEERSVVEVCLPEQWTAYQIYIAQPFRIYYLDLPQVYIQLGNRYPFIQVRQFGEFYSEVGKIEKSGAGA